MKLWNWEQENLPSVIHSIRTAIAATLSLAVARLFGLPEAYWAAITTLVVMQSTLSATVLISIAATALGALAGALVASYFPGNLLAFAAAVFSLGLLCAAFRVERNAYRNAGVTFAIIVLVPRANAAWIIALHRFFEVSLGIVIALAVVSVWPDRSTGSAKQNAQ
ncbi:MAG: FUSC family protein [Candidatus Udaeobacter sp.]